MGGVPDRILRSSLTLLVRLRLGYTKTFTFLGRLEHHLNPSSRSGGWFSVPLGNLSNEKNGNGLVFYQTGGGGSTPNQTISSFFLVIFFIALK